MIKIHFKTLSIWDMIKIMWVDHCAIGCKMRQLLHITCSWTIGSGLLVAIWGLTINNQWERSFNQITLSESARPSTKNYLLGSNDSQGSGLRPYYPVQRKWALGLQSPAQPRDIMIEVLKALQELNVRWKKNGDHNMKCRWCPGFPQVSDMLDANRSFVDGSTIMDIGDANGRLPTAIKFEIQLYKTKDDKYLLDMQRVTGPQLLFLEFCAAFLTNLRVL
uniref:non-specific serine/threonine protein kinase n=1 Tax=Aegilops tauschii subsp. strangulata TaxID=200361 RepID=A0A453GNP9_AEGTS